jgi:hypothetical protein
LARRVNSATQPPLGLNCTGEPPIGQPSARLTHRPVRLAAALGDAAHRVKGGRSPAQRTLDAPRRKYAFRSAVVCADDGAARKRKGWIQSLSFSAEPARMQRLQLRPTAIGTTLTHMRRANAGWKTPAPLGSGYGTWPHACRAVMRARSTATKRRPKVAACQTKTEWQNARPHTGCSKRGVQLRANHDGCTP